MATIGNDERFGSLLNITVINNNPIQVTASLIGGAESKKMVLVLLVLMVGDSGTGIK